MCVEIFTEYSPKRSNTHIICREFFPSSSGPVRSTNRQIPSAAVITFKIKIPNRSSHHILYQEAYTSAGVANGISPSVGQEFRVDPYFPPKQDRVGHSVLLQQGDRNHLPTPTQFLDSLFEICVPNLILESPDYCTRHSRCIYPVTYDS